MTHKASEGVKVWRYFDAHKQIFCDKISHVTDSTFYVSGLSGPQSGTWFSDAALKQHDLEVARKAWDAGVNAYRWYSEFGERRSFDDYAKEEFGE